MSERSARVVLPVRVEADRPALVDQAAAQLGVTRAEWLRRLVDRGLRGQGLLERPPLPAAEPKQPAPLRRLRADVVPRFKS